MTEIFVFSDRFKTTKFFAQIVNDLIRDPETVKSEMVLGFSKCSVLFRSEQNHPVLEPDVTSWS